MRTLVVLTTLIVSLGMACAHAAPQADLAKTIRERLDAAGNANASVWAGYVDDDCFCAGETKADVTRSMANRPATVKVQYGPITDLQTHQFGNVMVARYRVTESIAVDGRKSASEQWRTETYVQRGERWILVAGAENLILPDPTPIVVARETLAAYVGKYEYTPGSVDTVTLEGERLYVQPTGEPKVQIFPEDSQTFFAKGQPWRLIFRRNDKGAVTSLVFRDAGQEFVARRL